MFFLFVIFFDAPSTDIYTLSLHDALPIYPRAEDRASMQAWLFEHVRQRPSHFSFVIDTPQHRGIWGDRKSTRLNSSHANISYAVFCLKKKNLYEPLVIAKLKARPATAVSV